MRKLMVLAASLAISATALAASTPGNSPKIARATDNECTFFSGISDFKALDQTRLVIWAPGRANVYLVELGMPLFDLKFAQQLAFVDSNHDGRLCGYGMDGIIAGNSSFPQRSTILGMTRLDEAQLLSLEQQYNVKLAKQRKRAAP